MSKTKHLFHIWFLLAFILAGEGIQAQDYDYQGFHFIKKNRKKKRYSFKQYNNLIIIPVRINGSKPFNFILDTGVGHTLITDPSVALALGLPSYRQVDVIGVSNRTVLKAHVSNVRMMQIYKDIVAERHYVIVLEEDILNLSGYAGIPIHGLIGYDFFSRFVAKINYDKRQLTVYNTNKFKYRKRRKDDIIPIKIEDQKPIVEAKIICRDNKKPTSIKLVYDTGAGHALLLYSDSSPGIEVPDKSLDSHLGATLSGNLIGKLGRIQEIKLGRYSLPKVIASFPDSASYVSMKQFTPRNGNIGLGLIKRFHTIIDYPRQRLIIRPNYYFKKPFEYNRIGLEIIARPPSYKSYFIAHTRNNSPAAKAGLKQGDQIIAIDSKVVADMNISEVYGKLYQLKKDARRVVIFVKRGDEFILAEVSKSL